MRGFRIGVHGNFWSGRARYALHFGKPGNPGGDSDQAECRRHIRSGRLPARDVGSSTPIRGSACRAHRPPIPAERKQFIRHWIQQGCPDNEPAGQTFHGERDPAAEPLPPAPPPTDGEPLSFATDIRGLFRDFDREAMLMFADFDLHRYEDVRDHADAILARIEDGTCRATGAGRASRL